MPERKRCTYCAEEIRAEASRCPYCRSRVRTFDGSQWHRDHGDRKIAGVAAAVSHAFSVPVGLVRLTFVVLSFVHLIGVMTYGVLWLVLPAKPRSRSPLEQGLERAQVWAGKLARGPHAAAPAAGPAAAAAGEDEFVERKSVLDETDDER